MADDSFKNYVLDQLSTLPELRAKAMFGGVGLYQGARFFGILFAGRLYFKVSDNSRAAYVAHGMTPFTYTRGERTMTMSYYEVPVAVLDNREELIVWATQAIQAASTSAAKTPAKRPSRSASRRSRKG
ncbi:hypothetical protein LBMAG56_04870 [Verrucomicrobiota bacterium]|nr:hypothetical protein LBMAG56_04870 [Verrucomicrobiota bacterium]